MTTQPARRPLVSKLYQLGLLAGLLPLTLQAQNDWQFADVTQDIGVTYQHLLLNLQIGVQDAMSGGLAAADIDGNGLVDLYIPQGNNLPGRLLKNQGDGTFVDVAEAWGLLVSSGPNPSSYATGAAFADLTGNGYPDLVLGGVRAFGLRIYTNDGSQFVNATQSWGLTLELKDQWSVAFADVDGSGRLDVATTHWGETTAGHSGHLWLNQGNQLIDVGMSWGVSQAFEDQDFSFTPNFADLNGNGWPDLMIAADFGTSQYFINQDGDSYALATNPVISDENGMGAAVADFNNNGQADWFVTSIYHEFEDFPIGNSGNRLYLNDGNGQFLDATDAAGVREGDWGWGTCAADFNNNGYLDIFMVNGWDGSGSPFPPAASRMFVNQGDGSFEEQALELGLGHTDSGRGLVCFDYDRDGDIDIFIQNNRSEGRVYRNNASELGNHWLGIRLAGDSPNTAGVGARVTVEAGELFQTREMNIPNHYLSTSPPELLFGLGQNAVIDRVLIQWPGGREDQYESVPVDQWIVFHQTRPDSLFDDRFEEDASSP